MNLKAMSLRSFARNERHHMERPEIADMLDSAADEIERLQSENEEHAAEIDLLRDEIAEYKAVLSRD